MQLRTVFLRLAVLLVSSAAVSAQQSWTVRAAPGPGVDFTQIQDAVDAAGEGDLILVGAGSYDPVVIQEKSLTVQAEPGEHVDLAGPLGYGTLVVVDLLPNQCVTIRGIDAPAGNAFGVIFQAGIIVTDCDGPVLVEDGYYSAVPLGNPTGVGEGAFVTRSSSVTFVRCELQGLQGAFLDRGLSAYNSNVQFIDCIIGAGTDGAVVRGGDVLFSGTTVTGQADGMILEDGDTEPTVTRLDSTFTSLGGGNSITIEAGQVVELTGTLRSFAHNSPVREGDVATESYFGAPFELAIRALSPSLENAVLLPTLFGTVHLGTPTFLRSRGLVKASGVLERSFTLNDLGPGLDWLQLFEAAAFVDLVTSDVRLANPVAIVFGDAAL